MIRSRSESAPNSGTLTVAAAAGGNAADVTARLRAALAEAGLIAATDPDRVRRLAAALDVTLVGRVVSWAGGRSDSRIPDLLAELRAGQNVLVLVEAGAAGPGERSRSLVSAAAAAGLPVTALPGPSPVTAALAIAGLPAGRFIVEGSPPRSAEVRERRFAELAAEPRTLIFTESPDRLGRTLAELAAALGAHRSAAVCRALSTADQDVERGTLGELAGRLAIAASGGRDAPADGARSGDGDGRGDVTLVVAGAPRQVTSAAALALEADALEGAVAQVRAQVRAGATTRDAVAAVAARAGVRKRDLYNAVGSSGTGAARPTDAAGDRN